MFSGIDLNLLLLHQQINAWVVSAPYLWIVGSFMVAGLLYEVFLMLRRSMANMGIDLGFDRRLIAGNSALWGKGRDVDSGLLWAGYRRVGERTHAETWAAVDDEGNQVGDTVTVEFYERYKK